MHPKDEPDYSQHFHFRKMYKKAEAALGTWLYPDAVYGSGGYDDELTCMQIEGRCKDSQDQVHQYYWNLCGFPGSPEAGMSTYKMETPEAWILFRAPHADGSNGIPAGRITHITAERSITVLTIHDPQGRLHLDITRVPHQSTWWKSTTADNSPE